MMLMPALESEEEFNKFFERQVEYCEPFRKIEHGGYVTVSGRKEFEDFIVGLFETDGAIAKVAHSDESFVSFDVMFDQGRS